MTQPQPTPGIAPIDGTAASTADSSGVPGLPGRVGATVDEIEKFWRTALPALADKQLRPVRTAIGYEPSHVGELPNCDGVRLTASSASDNAFFCRKENTIVYDAEGLVPTMADRFGYFAVEVLLAHEYGHAVQAQLGNTGSSIQLELQADCFAGAWARTRRENSDDAVQVRVLQALLHSATGARSPIDEHGSGYQRVTAYLRGTEHGTTGCVPVQQFPGVLGSELNETDGDKPLNPTRDLDALIRGVVARLRQVEPGRAIRVVLTSAAPSRLTCNGNRARAEFSGIAMSCSAERQVVVDDAGLLNRMLVDHGDFAAEYVLAHSYFQTQEVADGTKDGPTVEAAADCRAGAFLADLVRTSGSGLTVHSADRDEAVAGLVAYPPRPPDFMADGSSSVMQRLTQFQRGYLSGDGVCRA